MDRHLGLVQFYCRRENPRNLWSMHPGLWQTLKETMHRYRRKPWCPPGCASLQLTFSVGNSKSSLITTHWSLCRISRCITTLNPRFWLALHCCPRPWKDSLYCRCTPLHGFQRMIQLQPQVLSPLYQHLVQHWTDTVKPKKRMRYAGKWWSAADQVGQRHSVESLLKPLRKVCGDLWATYPVQQSVHSVMRREAPNKIHKGHQGVERCQWWKRHQCGCQGLKCPAKIA